MDGSSTVPNDAKVMAGIMRSMGVEQWEPRVINQYLEFMYRTLAGSAGNVGRLPRAIDGWLVGYVSEVLQDAQFYSENAEKVRFPPGALAEVALDVLCAA
jgi:transcription initiation factor TFIID subunit 9B